MADTVTTQILENGPRYAVMKFTNVSDGTGEAGVVKVNATATGPLGVLMQGQTIYPGIHLKIVEIKYSTAGMAVRIQWQATANLDCLVLQATDHWQFLNERLGFGGLVVPPGTAGATGSILFSTVGAAANSSYTVLMTLTKNVPQS